MARYLWTDIEGTGLNNQKCSICEIACFITGDDFVKKQSFHEIIELPAAHWEMGALQMHMKSGLIDDMNSEKALSEDVVKSKFKAFLKKHHISDEPFVLAGSSIHYDKYFLEARWPEVMKGLFSHRLLDVSTIRQSLSSLIGDEKAFSFEGNYNAPDTVSNHRAVDDIERSYELFKYYIDKGWIGNLKE